MHARPIASREVQLSWEQGHFCPGCIIVRKKLELHWALSFSSETEAGTERSLSNVWLVFKVGSINCSGSRLDEHLFEISLFFLLPPPRSWMAGFSAEIHKNFLTEFHVTRLEAGARLRIDQINFWCGSDGDGSRTVFNSARQWFISWGIVNGS